MVMISGANSPLYAKRRRRNVITMGLAFAATAFGLSWLVLILAVLLWNGFSGLSLAVFTQMTPPPGSAGGLLNPIAGSLVMTAIAVAIGTPLGMLAGTYMAEYGRYDKLTTVVRFINDILLSAPSIVVGLFIYEIMVAQMGHFSGWAGAVALAVIVVPVVVRTTEDMLTLVPDTLREAAASIGLPRSLMIQKVAYRAARAGMITGVLLAVARISGETAPLLFTALNNQFWSTNLNAPVSSLPVVIFQFALSPYHDWQKLGLDRRLDHYIGGACAQHHRPVPRGTEKNIMSVASYTVPTVTHAATGTDGLLEKITIRDLDFFYGDNRALKSINCSLYQGKVTAFIGPSGCGKSTLLRILNRMYDLYPNQRAAGHVALDEENILAPSQDLNLLRAKVGMVFQKPTPFPMTIYENIAFGIRLYERLSKSGPRQPRAARAAARRAMGRGQGQARRQRALAFRRATTEIVHRAHRRGAAGGDPVRRTVLGARPDLHRQDRGADRRAQGRLHDRHRDPQHATGRARVRLHRLHVSRRAGRIRRNDAHVHHP